jgi:uroporphyrinogen-III synthase
MGRDTSPRVLVTRPQPGAARTAARLAAGGYQPVTMPLSEIVPLPPPELNGSFDAVAVSSANAVRHAPSRLVANLVAKPLFAVSDETALTASAAGFADVRSSAGSVSDLARDVAATVHSGGRIAYLCGRVRLDALEAGLAGSGVGVVPIETYDTRERLPSRSELAALDSAPIAAVLVYSARAADALAGLVGPRSGTIFRQTAFIAISDRVAERLAAVVPGRVCAAGMPNEESMFELLAGLGHEPAAFPGSLA